MRFALKRGPEQLLVEIAGRELPVAVRRNARARRLILRLDSTSGLPVLTLPARTGLAEGERFLRKNAGWLAARLAKTQRGAPLSDGCLIPLRGEPCRIVHCGGRGLVVPSRVDGELRLFVPGAPEHLPRRLTDWLKREARRDLEAAVARHGAALGKQPAALRVGDAKSRWGSCSARRVLTFSWRLILAPPHVLDYLVAHEVAHLVEMNHGARFWALVRRLDPDHETARTWLKRHGGDLHAVGRDLQSR
jgi:predicted metal-dependent hydrolase